MLPASASGIISRGRPANWGDPFADRGCSPLLLLPRFTRRHVKVALAGDGGDELFAGYDPFLAHRPASAFARVPRALRGALQMLVHRLPASPRNMSLDFRLKQFLRGVDAPPSLRHASWIASFLPSAIARILHPELRALASADVAFRQVLEDAARTGVRPGSVDEALRYYLTRYLAA